LARGGWATELDFREVLPNITKRAVSIIRKATPDPKTVSAYFAMTSPHTPWVPEEKYRGLSGAGLYGDYVAETDAMIGEVVKAVDTAGRADNTIIIVTSDNGADWSIDDMQKYAHRANFMWRGRKADIYEAGHRVPFIVRWPGHVKPHSTSPQLASLVRLDCNIDELRGRKGSGGAAEDSVSFVGALTGRRCPCGREELVLHSYDGMFAIRRGNWKLWTDLDPEGSRFPCV